MAQSSPTGSWSWAVALVALCVAASLGVSSRAVDGPFLPEGPGTLVARELFPYPCCLADGSCLVSEPSLCISLGGSPEYGAYDCAPNPCPQPQNILSLGTESGIPGSQVTVPLDLQNGDVVKGLQTDIAFAPSVVSYVSGAAAPRAGTMSFSASVVGGNTLRVVMYYADQSSLAPGSGSIASLVFQLIGSEGTSSPLTPESTLLSGPDGQLLPVTSVAGHIDVTELLGACCRADGTCAVRTMAQCDGAWLGPDTDCEPDPCALPNLRTDPIEIDPPTPTWADSVRIRTLVRNVGVAASGPSHCLLSLDGDVICAPAMPPLEPGEAVYTPWCELGVLAASPHETRACADALGEITEGNEADNCAVRPFDVGDFVLHVPEGLTLPAGGDAEIPIFLANHAEVKAVSFSLCLPSDVLTCQALLLEGTRAEGAAHVEWHAGPCPAAGIVYRYVCPAIGPGDGPIARLLVSVDREASSGPIPITFIDQPPSTNRVTLCDGGSVTPLLRPSEATITRADFIRSDVDGNGETNISDPVWSLAYQFAGGPPPLCLDAADDDDSGEINISDPIYSLTYQFGQGPAPLSPFPSCGLDPTSDPLDCGAFAPCQTGSAVAPSSMAAGSLYRFEWGAARLLANGAWTLPLYLRTTVPLVAFELSASYRPDLLEFVTLEPTGSWGEADFLSAQAERGIGRVRLGCVPDFTLRTQIEPGRHFIGRCRFSLRDSRRIVDAAVRTESAIAVQRDLLALRSGPDPDGSPTDPEEESSHAGVLTLTFENPYRPGQMILVRGGTPGQPMEAAVYDVHGRRVADLLAGTCIAEETELSWNGRTISGARAASGVYYLKVRTGGDGEDRRFLLVR